jgi:hypothetical protein
MGLFLAMLVSATVVKRPDGEWTDQHGVAGIHTVGQDPADFSVLHLFLKGTDCVNSEHTHQKDRQTASRRNTIRNSRPHRCPR